MIDDPLRQFAIRPVVSFQVGDITLALTNSALAMLIVVLLAYIFFAFTTYKAYVVPTRRLVAAELLYEAIYTMLESTTGTNAKRFFPFVFTLFVFILGSNLMGMVPYSFTVTSHIAVTFALAAVIFIAITIIGFYRHGLHYLSLFVPKGVPIIMAPLLIIIELFAYLARPVSLSIRLAANMTAGHIILKVVAAFVTISGFWGFFPFALLILLTGFEIFIAVLQAYIFSVLVCVYLNDAINLH